MKGFVIKGTPPPLFFQEKYEFFWIFLNIVIDSPGEALSIAVSIGSIGLTVPEIFRFYCRAIFSIDQCFDLIEENWKYGFFLFCSLSDELKTGRNIWSSLLDERAHRFSPYNYRDWQNDKKSFRSADEHVSRHLHRLTSVRDAQENRFTSPLSSLQATDFIRT